MHVCCAPCAAFPLLASSYFGNAAFPLLTSSYNGKAAFPLLANSYNVSAAFPLLASLRDEWSKFDITGLFYNPNIHPVAEFEKRLGGAIELFAQTRHPLIVLDAYMQNEWEAFEESNIDFDANEKKRLRCEMCYRTRLAYIAEFARSEGFEAFTTTLLISPYQDHELIKAISCELSVRNEVDFVYIDWRPYFRDGQRLARELGVYRQKYCGCIISAPHQ